MAKYVMGNMETREQLDKIVDLIWVANYTPYEPLIQLVFPVLGYQEADRTAAITESKARFWQIYQNAKDDGSRWFYTEDVETGEVVACIQVESVNENRSAQDPQIEAPWFVNPSMSESHTLILLLRWPEGEHRDFAESMLNQVYKARFNLMTRPFCGMYSSRRLRFSKS